VSWLLDDDAEKPIHGIFTEGEGSVRLTFHTDYYFFFTKQAILMRSSTVLSSFLQKVFPGLPILQFKCV
jgi:hypothetical protein